jgi:hypothetical protein
MSARKITGKGGCLAADVATALETRLWKPNLVPLAHSQQVTLLSLLPDSTKEDSLIFRLPLFSV